MLGLLFNKTKAALLTVCLMLMASTSVAAPVTITGYVRFAESVVDNNQPQARYIVEVSSAVFNTWAKKFADIRINLTTDNLPLIYNKGDYVLVDGDTSESNNSVIASHMTSSTAVEVASTKDMDFWMRVIAREISDRLTADYKYINDNQVMVDHLPPLKLIIARDNDRYAVKDTINRRDSDTKDLIFSRVEAVLKTLDNLLPRKFSEFLEINFKNEEVVALPQNSHFSKTYIR
jgi:hypothetical protein